MEQSKGIYQLETNRLKLIQNLGQIFKHKLISIQSLKNKNRIK